MKIQKKLNLTNLYISLGIRFVGETISIILAKEFVKIQNFIDSIDIREKLLNIDGLGPKVINSIISYLQKKNNIEMVSNLNQILKIQPYQKEKNNNEFSGKNIVFTGTLSTLSREEAKHIANQLGAKILNSVTKKTDFLICGEKPGSKATKAKELNIKILLEKEWISKIS